jgi:hypothetical protein
MWKRQQAVRQVEKKLERISETFMKLKIKVKSTIFSIAF